MRRLLSSLATSPSVRQIQTPKELELLVGADLYLGAVTNSNTKVIRTSICAKIISYYANHAKNKTETASYSLAKFAEEGINTWVDSIVKPANDSIEASLKTMMGMLTNLTTDMAEVKMELSKTSGYRAASATMPGLKEWMNNLKTDGDGKFLPSTDQEELFTLNEWAAQEMNGLILSKSNKHALAIMVSGTYKSMNLALPEKVIRLNPKTGYNAPPVQAYPVTHFPLLKMCFTQLVSK